MLTPEFSSCSTELEKITAPIQIAFSNLAVGALLLLPLYRFEIGDIPLLIGLGLIPTAIPFTLLSYGMARVKVEKGSVIGLLEPVTAGAVGYIAFREMLTDIQLLGSVMILSAVFIALNEKSEQ